MKKSLRFFIFHLFGLALGHFAVAQNHSDSSFKFEQTLNKPVATTKLAEGHYFIDFGKAYFGTVVLKSKLGQSDSVIIHLGEKLAGRDSIDRSPGGTIRYQQVAMQGIPKNEVISAVLKPDKRNTKPQAIAHPDSFGIVMPFRYCEIENLKIPWEDLEIYQKGFHYSFNDEASYFHSSDSILDSIYELCKHTIKATSFTGYYIDGDRERIPYEADAFINQLSHYAVDNEYSIARRTNVYFIDHATWPTEWLLHTALMYYYDYLYTDDLSLIEKYYENLKVKSLMDLEGENGLISTRLGKLNAELIEALGFDNRHESIKDIVDWPKAERDNYDFKEINTVVNAFYYENLRIMSNIADKLGKTIDAELYQQKANQVRSAIQSQLIDPENGLFIDGLGSRHSSLHANMFALAFGLVPEENLSQVISFIKTKGMACSVYGAQYLLEGLCKYDEAEYALELITNTNGNRNWHNMIKAGSTLTWEAWDKQYKRNLDWNHAWGTAPLNIIVRHIWGITPDQPGFNEINISPRLSTLDYSEIKVPTKHGPIAGTYRSTRGKKHIYSIELPEGSKAKFFIPKKPRRIHVNGKRLRTINEYVILENSNNKIELKFK